MKMVVNENVFEPIIDYLRGIGNDVLSIREGLSGISDDEVYQLACEEKRVILTMDKDFSRAFRFPPERCGGIIVVKVYKGTVEDVLKMFKKNYEHLDERDIRNNLIIITPDGIRIRRTEERQ